MNLDSQDLQHIVRKLPKEIIRLIKLYPARVFVSGGFVRGVIDGAGYSDIDLFTSSDALSKPPGLFGLKRPGSIYHELESRYGEPSFVTDNAWTFEGRVPIQLIRRWTFERPEEL